jgi:hypothetical protein
MIPIYGFLKGDTIGLLMLADPEESVMDVARRLQRAASVRVPMRDQIKVYYRNNILEPNLTVKEIGFEPLERFDVV